MSKWVRFGIVSFLLGVASGSTSLVSSVVLLVLVLVAFILFFCRNNVKRRIAFLLLFFVLGSFRMYFVPSRGEALLEKFVGQNSFIVGVVREEPDVREKVTHLVVGVSDVRVGTKDYVLPSEEYVLVTTQKFPEYHYGDLLRVRGKLSLPKNFENENGRSFDYVSYLKKDGIFYQESFSEISRVGEKKGNSVIALLYLVKSALVVEVSKILPEPEAGLLDGLLFGAKRALSSEALEQFRLAGIIHIVVLSGYNITIVADFFTRLFLFFTSRKIFSSVAGGVVVVFFSIMTGLGTSTLRAMVMSLLVIYARVNGRTAEALHLLFVAAFFMVLWNPLSLLYDPSFQLSFLATFGLLFFSPKLSPYLTFVTEKFGFREILATTLATQIFVLPLLLYETGVFSVVALFVNLLVLPLLPLAMALGTIAVLVGFISSFGIVIGFPLFLILSFVFFVSRTAVSLPFSTLTIPEFSPLVLVFIYFLYGIFYLLKTPHRSGKL